MNDQDQFIAILADDTMSLREKCNLLCQIFNVESVIMNQSKLTYNHKTLQKIAQKIKGDNDENANGV